VVARWEGGLRFPTATELVRACRAVGIDPAAVARSFHAPAAHAFDPERLGPWLAALAGDSSQGELARRAGLSRQQVGRALRGDADPRVPDLLVLVEAATGRVADWVALLVDVAAVPALAERVALGRSVRRLAFDEPWSPALLALLDTMPEAPADLAGLAADRLGLDRSDAERLVRVVEEAGALDAARRRDALTVDVAPTAEEHRRLRAHWARVAADRVAAGVDGDLFSFNVFAVSRADLARIRELQRSFYREVRAIVADSEPEVAAMLALHSGAFEPRS
jgi:transcriptional regulator with XRE-family HTH domain